jgi:hypothetical protein
LDLEKTALTGDIAEIQLKDKSQKLLSAYIETLPTKGTASSLCLIDILGTLYQYEKEYELASELEAKGEVISKPSLVKDTKARVLYIPNNAGRALLSLNLHNICRRYS